MNTSLLKRDLSVGWKGILILLIVLGHNSILCKPSIEADHFYIWRSWLYTFHVWAFFVLPFLYGCKELNLVDIVKHAKRNFIKLLVPYLWISVLCVFIMLIMGGQFQLSKIVLSFLVGSQWMTSTYMGFHFLWFLPTMLMVIVVRDVYFNVSQSVKMLIVLIAFCFWLLESLGISLGYLNYIPLNFVGSMKYILVGICARELIEASFHYKYIGKIMVSIFVLASMVFGYLEYHELNQIYSLFSQVIKILIPISFAYIIVSCQKWGRFHVLRFLGKYSLQIYLFHVIIYNVLLRVTLCFLNPSILLGVSLLILTIVFSLMVAIVINHYPRIMNVLFPR